MACCILHHPRSLLQIVCPGQGLLATLELLPMWSGVEPDVELYASGRVLDDDGEWSGAQTLADTAGPACIGLLPVSLSHYARV